jgi:uncharacterized membrane protein YeiH
MSNRSPIVRFRTGFISGLSLVCLLFLICIGPGSTQGHAAQVTLAWSANTDPGVAGYKLYYGKASRTYGAPVDVGIVTQYTLTGIEEGNNCYFAVTAYDTNRNESAFSTELECFTVVPALGVNGAISPSIAVVVSRGMSQTVTVAPAANYAIADVLVDGASVGAVATYTFSNVTAAHSISATFIATTHAITVSAGTNGTISPSGSVSVTQGASQVFAITANTGYQVKDVLVDGASVGAVASYTFSNVTAAHSITASFIAKTYVITASAGTNGTISPSGSVSVTQGASQVFAITANTGYQVKDVLVDGASVGAVASYTLSNVTVAHSIAASFIAKTYAITASAGTNGTISPSGSVSVTQGASQVFAITANTGYQVKDVLVDGASVGAVATYTFSNVTAAHSIAATFIAKTYAITVSAGTNGTISPSGSVSVTQGASQVFAITANAGYQVKDVLVDGASVGAVVSYTFSNVIATHSISATFAVATAQVTLAWNANVDPSVAGYKLYYGNTSRTYGAPVDVGKVTQYTFTGIVEGKTYYFAVTAYDTNRNESAFSTELECFTLLPAAGAYGTISPANMLVISRGMSQSCIIAATTGYHVKDVLVDGTSVGAVTSYTFSNTTAHHRIVASFIADATSITSASASTRNSSTAALKRSFLNIKPLERHDDSRQPKSTSSYLLAGSGFLPGSGGWIEVLKPQGEEAALPVHVDWPEYNKLSGEMRVATGDIDGDGQDEIIVGLGRVKDAPGIPGGYFTVLDQDYSVITWGEVEWSDYNKINGETRPACGDIDGDGIAEIIIGLGPGGEGRMEVFKLVDHQLKHFRWLQAGWQDYNRGNGEMRPACGDLDGDGKDEVIAGLGPVKDNPGIPGGIFAIFSQTSVGSMDLRNSSESDASGWGVISWPDYNRISGESWPACGDVNGDGKDEIVLGLGKQGEGRFEILGFDMLQNRSQHIAWQQSQLSMGAEVHPACGRVEPDAGDETVLGFSKGGVGFMEVFGDAAHNFQPIGQVQTQFKAFQKQESGIWPSVFRLKDQ